MVRVSVQAVEPITRRAHRDGAAPFELSDRRTASAKISFANVLAAILSRIPRPAARTRVRTSRAKLAALLDRVRAL